MLLGHLHKILQWCILRLFCLQEAVGGVHADAVADHIQEIFKLLQTELAEIPGLLEVLGVVVTQVLLSKTGSVWVVEVLLEGIQQQVQLVTGRQQGPVFVLELLKERHAIAQIQDILDAHDVEVFEVDLHGCGLLLGGFFKRLGGVFVARLQQLLLLFLQLLLFRLGLFGLRRLSLVGIAVFRLRLAPLLQGLLPLGIGFLEFGSRLQVLGALRQLLLQDPGFQESAAGVLGLPGIADLVEAFLLAGQREGSIALGQFTFAEVGELRGAVQQGLLLFGQVDLRGFLHLHVLCLRFFFLGFFSLFGILALLGILGLLRLLGSEFQQPLTLVFFLFLRPFKFSLSSLLSKHHRLNPLLVCFGRCTHDHHGLAREILRQILR
mmetsp:Transcript_37777/g.59708  ORF Transcript_37777/g.59708 Transcript_37777/m.59708 type:complete len:379 (-) Transcript_37777:1213-2349(-)